MKLTKGNLSRNRVDMVDFARQQQHEFYTQALVAYDTADEVVALALQEREAAFEKLAMQVKLLDGEAYAMIALDLEAMDKMSGGEKINHLISKGKYRLGHTNMCDVGDSVRSSKY